MRKIPFAGVELTSQRVRGLRGTSELPGRPAHDMLQIAWPFSSKIISGPERPEPLPRESRKGEETTSDFDNNDSYPSEVSAHGSRNSDEEPKQ